MMKRIRSIMKKFFLINDTPHKIAAGVALGVFFGILPGEGIITTLLFASLFGFNRLAAVIGVTATNMWGTFVMLPVASMIGARLFGTSAQMLMIQFQQARGQGIGALLAKLFLFDVALPLIIGFVIISGLVAFCLYAALYGALFLERARR